MELQAKYVFLMHTILAFIFGIGFLVAPEMNLDMMGYSTLGISAYLIQLFGSLVLLLGVQVFLIRNQPHSDFRQWIILSYIFGFTVLTSLQIYGLLILSIGNQMIWAVSILHILLIALYAFIFYTNMKK
ncbi:MAG: hypothetical protein E3J82_03835 [Candidatus Thorarchaeota archaeon]|nr:MAG: hypothetical protein E3J82_03835 [Candidatus Thorarchaeota archaeon]